MVFKIDTSFDSKSTRLSIKTKVTTMKREEKKRRNPSGKVRYLLQWKSLSIWERERKSLSKEKSGETIFMGIRQEWWWIEQKKQTAVNLKGLQSTMKKDLVVIRLQVTFMIGQTTWSQVNKRTTMDRDRQCNKPQHLMMWTQTNKYWRCSESGRQSIF